MDEYFIAETLKLARFGIGWVNPNPMVGAVLVKDAVIIGKGYHKKVGLPHAEIEALRSCKQSPKGTTLYVNLEPCTFFGRTPPCVNEIIKAGIKKVVCSTLDPNPRVNGQAVAILQKAGIEILVGILADEASLLNEAFFTFHQKKRPFIAIKFATSLDGKIAARSRDSEWITNEKARAFARKLRSQYQAILVGINTVLSDNPHLGVRIKDQKDPIRIILDSKLKIPLKSSVLRDKNVLIAATKKANHKKLGQLKQRGFNISIFDDTRIDIIKLLAVLRQKEIISCLVEGGGEVLGSFLDSKVVDKVYAFHSPLLIGGKRAISAIGGEGIDKISDAIRLTNISFKKFDDNLLTIGYTQHNL